MKTLNHSKSHAGGERLRGSIKHILIATGLAAAVAVPAWATAADGAVDAESAAHASWRQIMKQVPTPEEGCFHASYPNIAWERVECTIGQPRVHPVHVKPEEGAAEVVGNGHDYVAEAAGLISSAAGSFSIGGVKSEK